MSGANCPEVVGNCLGVNVLHSILVGSGTDLVGLLDLHFGASVLEW